MGLAWLAGAKGPAVRLDLAVAGEKNWPPACLLATRGAILATMSAIAGSMFEAGRKLESLRLPSFAVVERWALIDLALMCCRRRSRMLGTEPGRLRP